MSQGEDCTRSQASDYRNSTAFFVTPVTTKIHLEGGFLFLKKIPTFSKIPKYRCRQLKCSCSLAQKFHQLMTFWRNVTREQNISNPLQLKKNSIIKTERRYLDRIFRSMLTSCHGSILKVQTEKFHSATRVCNTESQLLDSLHIAKQTGTKVNQFTACYKETI